MNGQTPAPLAWKVPGTFVWGTSPMQVARLLSKMGCAEDGAEGMRVGAADKSAPKEGPGEEAVSEGRGEFTEMVPDLPFRGLIHRLVPEVMGCLATAAGV